MIGKQRRAIMLLLLGCFLCANTVLAGAEPVIFPLQIPEHEEGRLWLPERDPFNWPSAQQAEILKNANPPQQAFDQLTLQAIFWDDIPQAVINQTSLFEGDTIAGIFVLRIEKDKVTVELNNFQYVLQFAESAIDFDNKHHKPKQSP